MSAFFKGIPWIPALLVALVSASVLLGSRTTVWKQLLSVTVETPDGPVSARSVVRVSFTPAVKAFGPMDGDRWRATGEALALEVINGRWLFVLLPHQDTMLARAASASLGIERDVSRILAQRQPAAVPPRHYPMMVTFTDLSDPETMVWVDPNAMSLVFGDGVRLGSVTVQRTDDAVTEGVVQALIPWICNLKGQNIELGREPAEFLRNGSRESVRPHHFMIEDC